jgi:hypothetical protein
MKIWEGNSNGETYRSWLSEAGRLSLLPWIESKWKAVQRLQEKYTRAEKAHR